MGEGRYGFVFSEVTGGWGFNGCVSRGLARGAQERENLDASRGREAHPRGRSGRHSASAADNLLLLLLRMHGSGVGVEVTLPAAATVSASAVPATVVTEVGDNVGLRGGGGGGLLRGGVAHLVGQRAIGVNQGAVAMAAVGHVADVVHAVRGQRAVSVGAAVESAVAVAAVGAARRADRGGGLLGVESVVIAMDAKCCKKIITVLRMVAFLTRGGCSCPVWNRLQR